MYKRGFTIFFAVLVGSLALAIGFSIYELLIRELALSQTATQSQYAIYAADAGAECALYWDNKCTPGVNAACSCTAFDSGGACTRGTAFATSSLSANPASGVYCTTLGGGRHDIAVNGWPAGANTSLPPTPAAVPPWGVWNETTASLPVIQPNATTVFLVLLGTALTSPCAKVTVAKIPQNNGEPPRTTITSRGYNTCSNSGILRLERALQVSY